MHVAYIIADIFKLLAVFECNSVTCSRNWPVWGFGCQTGFCRISIYYPVSHNSDRQAASSLLIIMRTLPKSFFKDSSQNWTKTMHFKILEIHSLDISITYLNQYLNFNITNKAQASCSFISRTKLLNVMHLWVKLYMMR